MFKYAISCEIFHKFSTEPSQEVKGLLQRFSYAQLNTDLGLREAALGYEGFQCTLGNLYFEAQKHKDLHELACNHREYEKIEDKEFEPLILIPKESGCNPGIVMQAQATGRRFFLKSELINDPTKDAYLIQIVCLKLLQKLGLGPKVDFSFLPTQGASSKGESGINTIAAEFEMITISQDLREGSAFQFETDGYFQPS